MSDASKTPGAGAASSAASGDGAADPQELTLLVQGLLQQMQARFQAMSDSIIGKIDEMGGRIDELEKSIADLMSTAGNAPPASPKTGGSS